MEKLNDFWKLITDVWANGVFGVDIGKILVAAIIFAFFLAVRKIISRLLLGRLSKFCQKTTIKADEKLVRAIKGPVRMLPVVLGIFISTGYLELAGNWEVFADRLVRSLIVFMIFWTIYNIAGVGANLFKKLNKVLTHAMMTWFTKVIRFLLAFIGIATILEIWGIQVGPILAGLGLFGVAAALGAQDLFKNLIAGILVIAEKRFNVGDWIKVDGVVEGTVENIGFRSTVVRRFDKAPVYVPNTKFADTAVTNFSAMTHRRIYWKIGVLYSSSVQQLQEVRDELEKYVTSNEDFATPEEVATFVRIDSFKESSIDIMLYCFTKTTDWGEWLEVKERLAYKLKEIVENAGTGFAFPSSSIYIEQNNGTEPNSKAESFKPPKK